jgi:signal transduction histidine kinase
VKVSPRWRRPIVIHAARVAVVTAVLIGAMYSCVVVGFDVADRHRLVAQIDRRLEQRLDNAARHAVSAGSIANYDNAHDVDDAPVFLWEVGSKGRAVALTRGAPKLSPVLWSPADRTSEAHLGTGDFRLRSQRVGGTWFVVGQSLAEVDHVESDLIALEVVAGPVLLLAVFLGTLLIGIKAASPVEQARRRQLEFTADASHELRTPLSVIEAEVSLATPGSRTSTATHWLG